jgi:tetratricopeptide (TPR) repeat protein
VPLALQPNISQDLIQVNAQGIQEYQSRQFDQAKGHFEQVATGAPNAAEAHYNLGLALFALGESDQAREHFIEAANLAPGDKVIWDSPALRAYGSPDANIQKQQKDPNYSNQRPGMGSGPRR